MEEYKSNSHKSKEKQPRDIPVKKVKKVVTGEVRTRKKGAIQRFTDAVISDDISSVQDYIISEVLIPTAKKAIFEAVTNGIEMILYGESGRNRRSSTASRVSYGGYYAAHDSHRSSAVTANQRQGGYNYDCVIFNNRGEPEDVLTRMDELIATYGVVSVADFYDLVGLSGNYTDNKYGWMDIRSAEVIRVRDGYMIKFPKVMPLD